MKKEKQKIAKPILSEEQLESVNFHSGWDFSASAETDIYSICDGIVTSISFTQNENIPFNDQPDPKNSSGNSISVKCDYTNDIVYYGHLYPSSASTKLKVNSKIKKGQFVAKVGTTGRSTGNHLHLGLQKYNAFKKEFEYTSPTLIITNNILSRNINLYNYSTNRYDNIFNQNNYEDLLN